MSEDADTVEQFAERKIREVHAFVSQWRAGLASDPENWPERLPPPDWEEQFAIYSEGEL